jgi:hypothetical protein
MALMLIYIFSAGVFVELDKYTFETIEQCMQQLEASQQTGSGASTAILCVPKS